MIESVLIGTFIDRHMINNVRIRARKKKLELDDSNIEIDPNILILHLF